jgi:hypothetical protein
MIPILAYAEGADSSDSNLVIVVISLAIIAVVCILAAIPVATARRRRLGIVEGMGALMVVWGLLCAGVGIYCVNAQMNWTKQHTINIQSGYSNPLDESDRPKQPWAIWAGLAAIYAGGVIWSLKARSFIAPPPPAGFEVINPSPPAEPRD